MVSRSTYVNGFVTCTLVVGAIVCAPALLHFHSADYLRFTCILLIALLASTLKVRLPGMESTMSVQFLFVLLGVMELSLGETLLMGCAATLTQCTWKTRRRPEAFKVAFNVLGMSAPAIFFTFHSYHLLQGHGGRMTPLIPLLAALVYFIANTLPISIVIALSSGASFRNTWSETFFWSLPYYLIGAAVVGVIHWCDQHLGWQSAVVAVPLMYWVYRSYHLYLNRLEAETKHVEAEKRHVEEICSLHLRTIEGLALAIEAKDQHTHSHLHRVRTYASELGKELGLSKDDLDALQAAALLHDIGKLAVPDYIINKPGRLTPEEFEKMKIHPVVGAEILERVSFPYPVAPIVRSHHERWDGAGYPDGLVGEAIPRGARVLSVVDCLDALTSDRQYRKAIPIEKAIEIITDESGKGYDPDVVAALQKRWRDLEGMTATQAEPSVSSLSLTRSVERGEQPAAGLDTTAQTPYSDKSGFLTLIASARQEAHTLFELSQDLGSSLKLDETLSLIGLRLKRLVPYDSIAVWVQRDGCLVPDFVSGEEARLLSSLRIPVGSGLCGWVAQNATPIVNANPELEYGISGLNRLGELRSALAVPLTGVNGSVGVMALYRCGEESFTTENLRVLQVVTARVAQFIESAVRFQEVESSATIDHLTNTANARGLSIHLDQEIARCEHDKKELAVMVCDLDGFKEVNDCYGHLAGDKVLTRFSQLAKEFLRDADYLARMGGDEFVIISPDLPPKDLEARAHALSLIAQQAGIEVCGIATLSLSVGVAVFPADGQDAEKLFSEADKRMYSMKAVHHRLSGYEREIPPHTAR